MRSRAALLPVVVSFLTLGLKLSAYIVTNSVGLLSDAIESVANVATGLVTWWALLYSSRPPDDEHRYGHHKAEYFASGFQGALILTAAISILVAAFHRLFIPVIPAQLKLGMLLSLLTIILNSIVATALHKIGKRSSSIALIGEATHLWADVWATGSVLVGLGALSITGWYWIDPLCAILVSIHILRSGADLLQESALGLLDTSLPRTELKKITDVLQHYRTEQNLDFHAIRSRRAGSRRFVSLHVLVPGQWTVQQGHTLLEKIERDIRNALGNETTVFTHLEPQEDPCSFQDKGLDRTPSIDIE